MTERTDVPASGVRAIFWQDFVGQEGTKRRLDVRIEAALAEDRALSHVLLTGPPGCGKTTLANMVAMRLGAAFKPFGGPVPLGVLKDVLVAHEGERLTVFLDEVHLWTKREQEDLLTLLEEGYISDGADRIVHGSLTVIAGTTRRDKVIPALYDRFPIKPVFSPYTEEEMGQIVAGMAERIGVSLPDAVCVDLGRATAGTPRHARGLVEAARDILTSTKATAKDFVDVVLDLAGVTRDGLNEEHLRMLKTIADDRRGRKGLDPIAAALGLQRNIVEDSVEPLLIRLGYVEQVVGGREITEAGRERLAEAQAEGLI